MAGKLRIVHRVLVASFAAAALILAGGCVTSESAKCGEERCPKGHECDTIHLICVQPIQKVMCEGEPDGTPCRVDGVAGFHCDQGVCIPGRCGDGVVDETEQCDDAAANADDVPNACRTTCIYPRCGDGVVDDREDCDEGENNSDTRADRCRTNCSAPRCGDGVLDAAEFCDDGNQVAGDGCSPDCISLESCGNGVVDAIRGEICDRGADNSLAPNAECRLDCQVRRCGDGIVDDAWGESCDGSDLGGTTCQDLGFYTGTLACLPNCQFNQVGCSGRCGDGVQDVGEVCDGADFGGDSCTSFGFHTGALACNESCSAIDTSACSGRCGDGIRNGTEICDGASLGGLSCANFGFHSGTLVCEPDCTTVDTSGCSERCLDGIRNGSEVCDTDDFGGLTCSSFGYHSGSLGCSGDCGSIALSGCSQFCGDGQVNGNEVCDGLAHNGRACVDFGLDAGPLTCSGFCVDGLDLCFFDGTERFSVVAAGTSPTVFAVWGSGPEDVYAVGEQIFHYDGTNWVNQISAPPGQSLQGIWGSGPSDVWAVGSGGTVGRNDGSGWVFSTITFGTAPELRGVWGVSGGPIWTVGAIGGVPEGFVASRGAGWIQESLPGSIAPLTAVHGTSTTDIWAVSEAGQVLHDNGTGWVVADVVTDGFSGQPVDLRGVFAHSGEVFVVGDGTPGYQVWRRNAATGSFEAVDTGATVPVRAIWGTRPSQIFIAGLDGLIQEFDGLTWHDVANNTSLELTGVWGSANNDVFFSGIFGTVLHYRGHGWRTFQASQSLNEYPAVWAAGPAEVYAIHTTQVDRFNGTNWELPWSGPQLLNALWGDSPSNIFAAGNAGLVSRYDGTSWLVQTTNTNADLFGGASAGPNHAIAVGDAGIAVHFDGSTWRVEGTPLGTTLRAVWTWGPSSAVAVGDGGEAIGWDGTSWASLDPPTAFDLAGVWGTSRANLYVVGDVGTVLHYDGSQWEPVATGASGSLTSIHGDSFRSIYLAGGNPGEVHRFDGSAWSPTVMPSARQINSVFALADDDVYLAGKSGYLARFRGNLPRLDGGQCPDPIPIYCGAKVYGTTSQGAANFDSYGCAPRSTSSPEVFYKFVNAVAGTATLTLTPHELDLDLIVLGAEATSACDPNVCKASSQANDLSPEIIELDVIAGAVYYLVVDGYSGLQGAYTLEVSCAK